MTLEIDLDSCFQAVLKLIDEAGAIIISRNIQRKTFVPKTGDSDLLTETDQDIEKLFKTKLSSQFPTHKFIGEEESSDGVKRSLTDDPTWMVDPIDGTMNFVHGFPHFCVSVAFIVNKITEIGIIYNPILNQKFVARRGKGAFFNDAKINVSGQNDLNKALVVSEFGTSRDVKKLGIVHENFGKLSKLSQGIRCLGAAALNLCMVAIGVADANYEMGVHCWDIAAGDLLIREAGGVVLDSSGGNFDLMSRRILAASTFELGQEIAKQLTQYTPLPRDD